VQAEILCALELPQDMVEAESESKAPNARREERSVTSKEKADATGPCVRITMSGEVRET
jgi:hypothetical protein